MVLDMPDREYRSSFSGGDGFAISHYDILQQDYWRNPVSARFPVGNKTLLYA